MSYWANHSTAYIYIHKYSWITGKCCEWNIIRPHEPCVFVSAFLYVNLRSQMCIYVICNMWTCIYMCVPTENTCLGPECYNLDLEYGTCQTDRFGISHCVLKYRKYLKHVIWRVFKTKLHLLIKSILII